MRLLTFILTTCFINVIPVAKAQTSSKVIDYKYLAKIMAMPNDTNKLKAYFDQADKAPFLLIPPKELLSTSAQMELLAKKLNTQKYVLDYYFLMYHYHAGINSHLVAFSDINKALDLSRKLDDKGSTVHALIHVANSYLFMVENSKAFETYKLALSTAKKMPNSAIKNRTIASVLTRMAKFYSYKLGKYNDALAYNEQAVALLKDDKDDLQIGYAYGQLAKDNFNLKRYLPAYNYSQLYLKTSTVTDGGAYSDVFITLGKIYSSAPDSLLSKMGISPAQRYHKAIALFTKAVQLSEKNGNDLSNISQGLDNLSELYNKQGDYQQAYRTYREYIVARDSLENQKAKRTMLQMQLSGEFHKQADSLKFKERLTAAELHTKQVQSYYFTGGIVILLILSFFVFQNYRKANFEKHRSDNLLLNILPQDVAEELKEKGSANARFFEKVTVLFTDFVNFTTIAQLLTPQQLVDELHHCFKSFDQIVTKYNIEKIKTIGDAYLAVSGLPNPDDHHAENVIKAAIEIAGFIKERKALMGDKTFDVRVGIHSGSVVAGIVGVKKFAYDIWGDTVNTAARMEQNSEPGKINVSEKTYELVKNQFAFTYRGEIAAKNKGALKMYFVEV